LSLLGQNDPRPPDTEFAAWKKSDNSATSFFVASKPITIDPIAKPAYDRLAPREQTALRWGARAVVTGDAPGKRVFGGGIFSFEFRSDITVYVEDRPNEIRIIHIIEER